MDGDHREPRLPCRYRFGRAEFDELRCELRIDGAVRHLEPRPLAVLALLLRQAGTVVSKRELTDRVWAGRPTVDNVVANAVGKLRTALAEDGARIVTVYRHGYRFDGDVERIAARPALPFFDAPPPAADARSPQRGAWPASWLAWLLAAGCGGFALALAGVWADRDPAATDCVAAPISSVWPTPTAGGQRSQRPPE